MQKVSSRLQTLYSLQLLRFVAALFVLLYHLTLMDAGYKGVDIFFVISGFVMYYSTQVADHKNAAIFFINRLTKIYILYWLALLLQYFVAPYKTGSQFLATFFLLPNHHKILGVSWSLPYELYFYFLFGVTIYLVPKKYCRLIFLILLCITTSTVIINCTSFGIRGSIFNFLAGQNLWEFLLGILSCIIFIRFTLNPAAAAIGAVASLVAFVLLTMAYASPGSFMVNAILAFPVVMLTTMFEKTVVFNKQLAALIKILGDASYAMYLTGPIVTLVIDPETLAARLFAIIVVIIAAVVINKLIENPLLLIIRRALLTLTGQKKNS